MTNNEYRKYIEDYLRGKEMSLDSLVKHDPILENQVKFHMFTVIFKGEHDKTKAQKLNDIMWRNFIDGIRN